jgi:hydrogenase/urease accessory protein HupE
MSALHALVLLLVALIAPPSALAHETRPAYLELKEVAPNQFELVWRTPVLAGRRLPVALKLPADVSNVHEPVVQDLGDSILERRTVDVGAAGLAGKRIDFPGLQVTITDVLVRLALLDGRSWTLFARPGQPWIEIERSRGAAATALAFVTQGIQHIALGFDHLLLVLGLLFIVRTTWTLVKTLTAFTVAHSITLTMAALGHASVPVPPLEALIALSVLFLGPEIVRARRGQTSLTIRQPWIVAFAFGLLHGFGFASGLALAGLPQRDIPLALLTFNVGVEIGQLAFVALILLVRQALEALQLHRPRALELAPAYVVGSLGAFWTIQRVAAMLEVA